MPYVPDLMLPEEDSVALGRKTGLSASDRAAALNIGVVRLPHISNYTDFDPLEQEPGVFLRYLDHRAPWPPLDLLILPGTKNTISDLLYLKDTGLFGHIQAYAQGGGRLVGICGGYQLLGLEVRDPLGVEGPPRAETGLGLLPVVTTMAGAKTTTQVQARTAGAPAAEGLIEAYEIHMGVTEPRGPGEAAFEIINRNGRPVRVADGWVSPYRTVWGTYLHGLFENDAFRQAFLHKLGKVRREVPGAVNAWSFRSFQEAQLDRLADLMRRHLDWPAIRALMQPL
jgi:adenosylcobyric acid synthase